ncbi:MAG: hypothetical protein ACE5IR_08545 [bacterium]
MSLWIRSLIIANWLIAGFLFDEPKPPDGEERQKFVAKVNTLQKHSPLLPLRVYDVIFSLTDTLWIAFDCPDSAEIARVQIEITTEHIKWDRNLTIDDKLVGIAPEAVAYYIWRPITFILDDKKHVRANNYIMFTSEILTPTDSSMLSPLGDEAILYHELLHGQFAIEAMYDSAWRASTCECDFDLEARDPVHEKIPDLVFAYLANLAEVYGEDYIVDIPPRSPDAATDFEFVIGQIDILGYEGEWESQLYYPERANIDPESFEIKVRKNKILATGHLLDQTHRGFVLVRFIRRK